MAVTVMDRRVDVRRAASAWGVSHATLRPGTHVHVVDLSPSGARIETSRQLRPGARVHIRIVTERCTVSVAAQVLRCAVCNIHPDRGVTYRGALRFDERCHPDPRSSAGDAAAAACAAGE